MMYKFVAAALVAVTAQVVDAQSSTPSSDYLPFQNPGSGKCVVKGAFNSQGSYYALKLGSCSDKNVSKLRHVGSGKELRTSDKYCIDTKVASNKVDIELILRKCPDEKCAEGLKWTKVGRNQWQNGYKQCFAYNTKTCKFEQRKCETVSECDDKKSYQQWKFVQPTKITCSDWSCKWKCDDGWVLDKTSGLTCYGATDASCASVCCKPPKPAPKPPCTCKSSGFANKCPSGYKFVDRQCGNAGQPKCNLDSCCEPIPAPTPCTCKSAGFANKCPGGYKFVDRQCGNPGQAKCSMDTCCDPLPTPPPCTVDCAPKTCKSQGFANQCPSGYKFVNRQCGNKGQPACSCDVCCDVIPTPPKPCVDCRPPTPPSPSVPDTCRKWSKRVVQTNPIELTGYEVCYESNKWAGMMDESDPRFDEPCVDNGKQVVCKPALCCIHDVMPIADDEGVAGDSMALVEDEYQVADQ